MLRPVLSFSSIILLSVLNFNCLAWARNYVTVDPGQVRPLNRQTVTVQKPRPRNGR